MLVHHPDKKGEDQQDEGDNHFKCIKIGQSVGVADTSAHTHMYTHTCTYLHSLLCTLQCSQLSMLTPVFFRIVAKRRAKSSDRDKCWWVGGLYFQRGIV